MVPRDKGCLQSEWRTVPVCASDPFWFLNTWWNASRKYFHVPPNEGYFVPNFPQKFRKWNKSEMRNVLGPTTSINYFSPCSHSVLQLELKFWWEDEAGGAGYILTGAEQMLSSTTTTTLRCDFFFFLRGGDTRLVLQVNYKLPPEFLPGSGSGESCNQQSAFVFLL